MEQLLFCDEVWHTKHAVVDLLLLGMMYLPCCSEGRMHFLSSNSHPGLRDAFVMAACNPTELGRGEIVGK